MAPQYRRRWWYKLLNNDPAYIKFYEDYVVKHHGPYWYMKAAANNWNQFVDRNDDEPDVTSSSSNATNMPKRQSSPVTPVIKMRGIQSLSRSAKKAMKTLRKARLIARSSPGVVMRKGGKVYKKRPNRYGASSSKSAGFFKSGSRRQTSFDKVGRQGITVCRELGNVAGDATAECQYVMHATMEPYVFATDLSRAITKWLAIKLGKDLSDFSSVAYGGAETNPQITFRYRLFPTGAILPYVVPITLGTTTWDDIAVSIRNGVINITDSTPFDPLSNLNYQIQSVTWTIGGQTRSFNLLRARIQIYIKSALKIQNRTVNLAANDEEDDVDNVPLYGKSYEGTGNYFTLAGGPNGFDTVTVGVPARNDGPPTVNNAATGVSTLTEPPKASQLYRVKKNGKAHLDPGQVKTSLLIYRKSLSFNSLIKAISKGNYPVAPPSISTCSLGNFRCFAFEKMLNAVATTDVNGIKLAYEHDHKTAVSMFAPPVIVTNTIVTRGYGP